MLRILPGLLLMIFLGTCDGIRKSMVSPLEKIIPLAESMMNETEFGFERVLQAETHRIQRIEPGRLYGPVKDFSACALSYLQSEKDTGILFGISYAGGCRIRIKDETVFTGRQKNGFAFREYTYDRFRFDTVVLFRLKQGFNKITARIDKGSGDCILFLRPVDDLGNEEPSVDFSLLPFAPELENEKWLVCGPFRKDAGNADLLPPETELREKYLQNGSWFTWSVLPQNTLLSLTVNPENAFAREPYADWHYGMGATILGFFRLAELSGDDSYVKFAAAWADFAIDNLDYFTFQHDEMHAIRGSYHRLVRRAMLDDCGAPSLPLLELYLVGQNEKYRPLIDTMADYIRYRQMRLEDGTFCRPEPVPNSVWADDLFMSTPFMLRMARITGDTVWYDDAARQAMQFKKYLFDEGTGLYHHGWFSPTNSKSGIHWCRANGWVAWATAEILEYLPRENPAYQVLLEQFNAHMAGLAEIQDRGGLWHQVLDHPETYLETSGSAMFVLAMARGVREGWLPASFRDKALQGWEGISDRISEDGIVSGICRGTPIGRTVAFYQERNTFDNDPRGLGAVIQAGIEMEMLLNPNEH